MTNQIRFEDGAAYERYMGLWSQKAGAAFLDWLAPAQHLAWLDVGCGNGAFTEMIAGRCAPASIVGVDPSAAQLAYARTRQSLSGAEFRQGDAMSLPLGDNTIDAAVMPLSIFFVPDPARGVAELARVTRPGGSVSAYGWDLEGGGFPYAALLEEMQALGVEVPQPPSVDASRRDVMHALWTAAGLEAIETAELPVERSYTDFDDYWTTIFGSPSASERLRAMTPEDQAQLAQRLRRRLSPSADGRITCRARANAVRGRVPLAAAR